MKKIIVWVIFILICLSFTLTANATENEFTRASFCKKITDILGIEIDSSIMYNQFTDLDGTEDYYGSVLWMVENGYMVGYEDGEFKPNNPITNAEVAKILVYMTVGEFLVPDDVVLGDEWYAKYAWKAKQLGLMSDVETWGWYDITCEDDIDYEVLKSLFAADSLIVYEGACGEKITWSLDKIGVLTISGQGEMENYYARNRPPWYSYRYNIKKVIVTDGITSVGNFSFADCYNLINIDIGCSVTSLGSFLFENSNKIKNLKIMGDIDYIEQFAFIKCNSIENLYIHSLENWCKINFDYEYTNPLRYVENLYVNNILITELVIPNSVTFINNNAFYGYKNLSKVVISDNVVSIGRDAFTNCGNLKSVLIGKNVSTVDITSIPNNASIIVDAENSFFSFESGVLYNKDKTKLIQFFDDGTRKNYTIPDSVTQIDKWAFQNCTVLEKIIIGNGIRNIGQYAFSYCMSVTEVEIGENVKTISSQAFYNCDNLESITIPDSVTTIGNDAFLSCKSLREVNIGKGVWTIGSQAFSGCISLDNIIIPNNLTTIGWRAFESCISLKEITLGNNVKTIYDRAFYGCKNLENINIKNQLTQIGEDAFYGCNKLKTVKYFDVKEKWDAITVATGNDCITKSTILCTDTIDIFISDEENNFIVSPSESINTATVLLALYKDNMFVNVYISNYEDEEVLFNVCEDYDVAKIFIWGDLKSLQPICSETYYYKYTYKFLNLCNNTTYEWNGIFEALTSGLYEYYNYSIITAMDERDILELAREIYYIQNEFSSVSQFNDICKEAYNNLYN